MTQEHAIIVVLLVMVGVLFANELRRQWRERNADIASNPEKAERILRFLDTQAELISSLNGRVDTLGEVMDAVVKILEKEHKEKAEKNKENRNVL